MPVNLGHQLALGGGGELWKLQVLLEDLALSTVALFGFCVETF